MVFNVTFFAGRNRVKLKPDRTLGRPMPQNRVLPVFRSVALLNPLKIHQIENW